MSPQDQMALAKVVAELNTHWKVQVEELTADVTRLQKLLEVQAKVTRELSEKVAASVALLTREAFAALLVTHGLFDSHVVTDPQGYDHSLTLGRIYKVHAALSAKPQ